MCFRTKVISTYKYLSVFGVLLSSWIRALETSMLARCLLSQLLIALWCYEIVDQKALNISYTNE